MNRDTAPEDFTSEFEALGLKVAERFGFAVRAEPGAVLSPEQRTRRVKNKSDEASRVIGELQQWLVDDDENVRSIAREGVRKALLVAYTGDIPEVRPIERSAFALPDRVVGFLLGRRLQPDAPAPAWARGDGARNTRRWAIALTVVSAVAAALCLATGRFAEALVLLALTALLDVSEGAFARATFSKDPHLRWRSCVASHAADILMLGGIAFAVEAEGLTRLTPLVIGMTLFSLFAAFVRVSALQAGYRFWRSRLERLARWAAIAFYAVSATLGHPAVGAAVVCLLLAASSVYELVRVLHGTDRLSNNRGGILLLNDDRNCQFLDDTFEARPLAPSGAARARTDNH